MASTKHIISNVFAFILVTFAAFCFQGHLTSQFTPSFSAQVAASIRPLNENIFWLLRLSDQQLNLLFALINVVNIVTLVPPGLRKTGFLVNMCFYAIGLAGNQKIGEPVEAHVVLVGMCALGFLLR